MVSGSRAHSLVSVPMAPMAWSPESLVRSRPMALLVAQSQYHAASHQAGSNFSSFMGWEIRSSLNAPGSPLPWLSLLDSHSRPRKRRDLPSEHKTGGEKGVDPDGPQSKE